MDPEEQHPEAHPFQAVLSWDTTLLGGSGITLYFDETFGKDTLR